MPAASRLESAAPQPGQRAVDVSATAARLGAPHAGQKAAPSNSGAKHDGQVTAASRARQ